MSIVVKEGISLIDMFGAIIFIWLSALLLWYYLSRKHIITLGSKLPGPPALPFLGNILMFIGNPESVFRKIRNILDVYKRMAAIWIGPKLHVIIFNAEDTEKILKSSRSIVKADEYQFLRSWLGESILISEGAKFRQNKKLLTPAFHASNLKQYLNVFSEHVEGMIKDLEEKLGPNEFDVHPYLSMTTMYVLLESFMGVKKETLGSEVLSYSKSVEKLGRCAHIRIYKPWLHFDFIFNLTQLKKQQDKYLKIINSLTEKVIQERKKEYISRKENQQETGEKTTKWPIFLDKFLEERDENGLGLTDKDIKDEVMTMMFAGQDTTSVSIGFALCLLGLHPNVQEKLIEEVDSIFENDQMRKVSYEDCKKMHYMEQIIQETWRLFPPIPLVGRKPVEDIDLGDLIIPKDCTIALIIMAIQRDAAQYENPNEFDPDNFLPDKIKDRNPYSFLPFSLGYRTCIGSKYAMLLIKVVLSYIFRSYKVSSTIPFKKYQLAAQTTLKRKDGFQISIKKRSF